MAAVDALHSKCAERCSADRLPAATFIVYEDCGHFVYLDEPERFARDVVEFLRQLWVPSLSTRRSTDHGS
jgi:pimeloyl-ACP methyl ester carboxylesterase